MQVICMDLKNKKNRRFYPFLLKFLGLMFILTLSALFCNRYFINYVLTNTPPPTVQASTESENDVDSTDFLSKTAVVLDAGHGGRDGGAVAADGTLEKELNLKIAEKIYSVLSLCGYDCVMTRDDDYHLTYEGGGSKKTQDLKGRLEIASRYENCIFVSIHMNSYPNKGCHGLQVYYSDNTEEGKTIAETVMKRVKEGVQPENKRPIKAAGSAIYILKKAEMPAVLIECGFLSNPAETELLKNDDYQTKLSLSLAAAVMDYLEGEKTID